MQRHPLRILYLAPEWLHAKAHGKQLRLLHIGRALKAVGEITVAVVSATDSADAFEKTSNEFQVFANLQFENVPKLSLRSRLRWWLDARAMNPRLRVNEEGKSRLFAGLPSFDLVWLNDVPVPDMFGRWHWPRSVLDIDDIPSMYEHGKWQNGDRLAEQWKAGIRMLASRRREKWLRERFSILSVCSEADRQYLSGGDRVHVIPNGFERPKVEPRPVPTNPPRLGLIANFLYPPNIDGAHWFIRECWPRVRKEYPDVTLRLVGDGSRELLGWPLQNVDCLGWVAEPAEEIATWSAMIVPLHQGAGTRIKVAEAFARKCPLISTRLGTFGYDVIHGREAWLADTAEAFAQACVQIVREPRAASEMAERAWRRFLDRWTWDAIAPNVWQAAEHCLKLNARA